MPLRTSNPTINLTMTSSPLKHVLEDHVFTSFKNRQGWQLNDLPEQPLPVLDHPCRERVLPNIQTKTTLMQFETISFCPITCYLAEEPNTSLLQPLFRLL